MNQPIRHLVAMPIASIYLMCSTILSPIPSKDNILAQHEISLDERYSDSYVNDVFKDNILLNLAYMSGKVTNSSTINWEDIRKPSSFEFKLEPSQVFAFHEDVDEKYKDILVKTTNAHFNAQEGFRSDGYLYGDGVCHFASLIYWAAKDAGLEVEAPSNHNFAQIPQIPQEYGVAIYYNPNQKLTSIKQNLYIKNNKSKTLTFRFDYINDQLSFSIIEDSSPKLTLNTH